MASERCQYCGHFYLDIYRAPSELWAKIATPKMINLLCMDCFSLIAKNQRISIYWECAENDYPTNAVEGK